MLVWVTMNLVSLLPPRSSFEYKIYRDLEIPLHEPLVRALHCRIHSYIFI
jgi:hypothetical protein